MMRAIYSEFGCTLVVFGVFGHILYLDFFFVDFASLLDSERDIEHRQFDSIA